MIKEGFLNIPLNLLIFTAKESLYGQFHLYCYCKANAIKGVVIIDKDFKDGFCKLAGITERCIRTHLNYLIKNKWLYKIQEPNFFIVIAFSKLNLKQPHITTLGAIYEPLDFVHFRSFIDGCIIKYYGSKKTYFDRKAKIKEIQDKESSSVKAITRSLSLSGRACTLSFSLPHSYLARCMDISISKARLMRKRARKYVTARHKYVKQKIDKNLYDSFKKYSGFESRRIVMRNGVICIQESDYLYCNITLRRIRYLRKKKTSILRGE